MKKSTKYIVLAILILAFVAIVWYYRADLFSSFSTGSMGAIPVPSEFPLAQGSRGSKVTALQNALNARGESLVVDGIFGSLTLAALQRQFNVSQVSETLYNQITNG